MILNKNETIKKWQPINIALGLLVAILACYFNHSNLFLLIVGLIAAVILILTRKNNFFTFLALLIISLTKIFYSTPDIILIMASAMYMLISVILRIFNVKKYALIGLIIAAIIGLGAVAEYKMTFISEQGLIFRKEINQEYAIILHGSDGQSSDIYHFGQIISPETSHLPNGTYAYRVLMKNGGITIPLDQWPIFHAYSDGKIIKHGLIADFFAEQSFASHGTFNQNNFLPLDIGAYTIQLVKIEKPTAIIISERDFSITAYAKEELSQMEIYMTADDNPQKYYDTYTHTGNSSVSVTAWIQPPVGEEISGKVKYFLMSPDEKKYDEWQGESFFETNPAAQPQAINNMSGHIYPGTFHFQIIIDGNLIRDLKYISN